MRPNCARPTESRVPKTSRVLRIAPVALVEWATRGGTARLLVLHVDEIAVKKFQAKGHNQMAVVAAFEAQGWPRQIHNPLNSCSPASTRQRPGRCRAWPEPEPAHKVIRFHTAQKGASVRYELLR